MEALTTGEQLPMLSRKLGLVNATRSVISHNITVSDKARMVYCKGDHCVGLTIKRLQIQIPANSTVI